jgi:hypothetical protein
LAAEITKLHPPPKTIPFASLKTIAIIRISPVDTDMGI